MPLADEADAALRELMAVDDGLLLRPQRVAFGLAIEEVATLRVGEEVHVDEADGLGVFVVLRVIGSAAGGGATCTSGGAPDCQFPAKCRNGKCATLDPSACK